MSQRFYSDEEAEAILLAASQKSQNGISRESLLKTAAELGISAEEVEEAEQSLQVKTQEGALRKEFDRHQSKEFFDHLAIYLIVNGFLVLLDFATSGWHRLNWCFYPIIGWGIAIPISYMEAYNRKSASYEKAFEKWKKKKRRKELSASEMAKELVAEWLRDHPGDAQGAKRFVRSQMEIRGREARVIIERELSQ